MSSSSRRPVSPTAPPFPITRSWSSCGGTSASRTGLPGDEVRAHVEKRLESLGIEGDEPVTLVAHFLGISAPESFLLRFSGPQLKERTFDVLRTMLLGASATQPAILVVENVHWIDSSSDEFLKHLAAGLPGHRLLLLLTSRLDHTVPWLSAPLARDDRRRGPGRRRGRPHDPGAPRHRAGVGAAARRPRGPRRGQSALRRGDPPAASRDWRHPGRGRRGGARPDRTWRSRRRSTTSSPPASTGCRTRSSTPSRSRRSWDGRSRCPCSRAPSRPRPISSRTSRELQASDFLFLSAREPELVYTFKHALTQDVAYSSLLERRRRTYHAAVGRGLEELRAGRLDEVVELLAYHFGKSAEGEKAVDYAILAAEKAQRRWANTEALAQFEAALKRVGTMPDTQPNRLRRIDAVVKQAEIKFALGRHAEHIQALEAIRDAGRSGRRSAAPRGLVLLGRVPAQPHRRSAGGAHRLLPRGARRSRTRTASTRSAPIAECCLTHVYGAGGQPPGGPGGGRARARDLRGARERLVGMPDALGPQHGRERLGRVGAEPGVLPPGARAREDGERPPAEGGRLVADWLDARPAGRRGGRPSLLRGGAGPLTNPVRRGHGPGGTGIRPGQGRGCRRRGGGADRGGGMVRAIEPALLPLVLGTAAGRGLHQDGRACAGAGARGGDPGHLP